MHVHEDELESIKNLIMIGGREKVSKAVWQHLKANGPYIVRDRFLWWDTTTPECIGEYFSRVLRR